MARTAGDQQPAEERHSDQTEEQDSGTENTFTFGEIQWMSSLHSSVTPPTSDRGGPAQSESGRTS